MQSERGSVTAEFAVLLPVFVIAAIGFAQLGSLQVSRAQLAVTASVAARAASHLMNDIEVNLLATRLSPNSALKIEHDAEVVCATVTQKSLIEISEKICTRMQGQ